MNATDTESTAGAAGGERRQVLMGSELWDMIGGLGAYAELLDIIEDVHAHLPEIE